MTNQIEVFLSVLKRVGRVEIGLLLLLGLGRIVWNGLSGVAQLGIELFEKLKKELKQ